MKNGMTLGVIIAVLLGSCSFSLEKKVIPDINRCYQLIGERMSSLDSIIPSVTDVAGGKRIIYLFNSHDCGDCIDMGFSLLETSGLLDIQSHKVSIIGTMLDSCIYQYRDKVYQCYVDKRDLIRRELKYPQTPLLLCLYKDSIVDALFLENELEIKDSTLLMLKRFINID